MRLPHKSLSAAWSAAGFAIAGSLLNAWATIPFSGRKNLAIETSSEPWPCGGFRFKMIAAGALLGFPISVLVLVVDSAYLALLLNSLSLVPSGLIGPSQNTA